MPEKEVIQLITKSKSAVEKEIRKISKELIAIEDSVQIKEAGMNYAASGSNPYLKLIDSHGQEAYYAQSYLGNMYIGPTYTKAVGININGEIIQLGAFNEKTVFRKIFDVNKAYPADTDILIGTIGQSIDTVLDIKQVIYWNNNAWDLWYSGSSHNYIGIRVDLATGNVYAHSCASTWPESRLIVFVDYTLA